MENVLTKIVEIQPSISLSSSPSTSQRRTNNNQSTVVEQIKFLLCPFLCVYTVYNTLIVLLSFENFQSMQLFKLEFNALEISIKKLTFFGSTLDLWLRWDWPIYFSGCRNLCATAKLIRISVPVINRCFFLIQVRSVVMS